MPFMKSKRRWLTASINSIASLALLVSIAAPAHAFSFVRCRDVLHRCPKCDGFVNIGELPETAKKKSTGAFDPAIPGRQYRTDGSWSFHSPDNDIVRCPLCQKYFWRRDAKRLDPPSGAEYEAAASAPNLFCYKPFDWNAAIAAGAGKTTADRRYLRQYAWWSCNSADCLEKGDPIGRRNVEEIVLLIGTTEPGDRLLRAEALRELGRFDEALALLEDPLPPAYEGVRAVIAQLARARDTKVRPIPGPCQPTNPGGPAPSCAGLATGELDDATRRTNDALLDMVDALIAAPDLTKASVEGITELALANQSDRGGWTHYESDVQESVTIARAELSVPPADSPTWAAVASLYPGTGVALREKEIEARYSRPQTVDILPTVPRSTIWTYLRNERRVSFILRPDDGLVETVTVSE